jgi:hypothetical protein
LSITQLACANLSTVMPGLVPGMTKFDSMRVESALAAPARVTRKRLAGARNDRG